MNIWCLPRYLRTPQFIRLRRYFYCWQIFVVYGCILKFDFLSRQKSKAWQLASNFRVAVENGVFCLALEVLMDGVRQFLLFCGYSSTYIYIFHHCSTEFDKSVETQSKNQGWKEKRSCFWRLPWWYTVKLFIFLDIFFTTNSLDFDSAAFETWLKDLLEELKARYGEKVVIVLDNAPYHGRQVSSHMLSFTTI